MAGQKGNSRTTGLEQYYTPSETADALTEYMLGTLKLNPAATWLEPAAGSGAFLHSLHSHGVANVLAFDIDPKTPLVKKADFLDLTLTGSLMICLTNPPFGRNHSLSIPFFRKAAQSSDTIAFVVPRSWRKWSIVNRLPKDFIKIADFDLAVSYVDAAGVKLSKSSQLSTIFQVWQRSAVQRPTYPAQSKRHFNLTSPAAATGSLTIFGRGCGTLKRSFPAAKNTTQMFIDASPAVLDVIAKVDFSPFFTQVAYTEALSRVEIDFAIEHYMKTGKQLPPNFLKLSTLATVKNLTRKQQTTLS